ncbi:hypothetical protein HK099_006369, partial [Clydaea vesicula]
SHSNPKKWLKRFFKWDGECLKYFHSDEDSQIRWSAGINKIASVTPVIDISANDQFGQLHLLELKLMDGELLELGAATIEDKKRWIDILNTAMNVQWLIAFRECSLVESKTGKNRDAKILNNPNLDNLQEPELPTKMQKSKVKVGEFAQTIRKSLDKLGNGEKQNGKSNSKEDFFRSGGDAGNFFGYNNSTNSSNTNISIGPEVQRVSFLSLYKMDELGKDLSTPLPIESARTSTDYNIKIQNSTSRNADARFSDNFFSISNIDTKQKSQSMGSINIDTANFQKEYYKSKSPNLSPLAIQHTQNKLEKENPKAKLETLMNKISLDLIDFVPTPTEIKNLSESNQKIIETESTIKATTVETNEVPVSKKELPNIDTNTPEYAKYIDVNDYLEKYGYSPNSPNPSVKTSIADHIDYLFRLCDFNTKMLEKSDLTDKEEIIKILTSVSKLIIRSITVHIMISDMEKFGNVESSKVDVLNGIARPVRKLSNAHSANFKTSCLADVKETVREVCFTIYNFSVFTKGIQTTLPGWNVIKREAVIQASIKHHLVVLDNLKGFEFSAEEKKNSREIKGKKSGFDKQDILDGIFLIKMRFDQVKQVFSGCTEKLPLIKDYM